MPGREKVLEIIILLSAMPWKSWILCEYDIGKRFQGYADSSSGEDPVIGKDYKGFGSELALGVDRQVFCKTTLDTIERLHEGSVAQAQVENVRISGVAAVLGLAAEARPRSIATN